MTKSNAIQYYRDIQSTTLDNDENFCSTMDTQIVTKKYPSFQQCLQQEYNKLAAQNSPQFSPYNTINS